MFFAEINLRGLVQIRGKNVKRFIVARGDGDPSIKINRSGQCETIVVVGMLTDEINAAGRAKDARFAAKSFGKNIPSL